MPPEASGSALLLSQAVPAQYLASVGDVGEEEDDFLANVEKNTRRYQKIFSQAADESLPTPTDTSLPSDIFDVLATQARSLCSRCSPWRDKSLERCAVQRANLSQRRREEATQEGDPQASSAAAGVPCALLLAEAYPQQEDDGVGALPAELLRRYEVVIRPRGKAAPIKLREVCARHVGRLVTVRVRCSPDRPPACQLWNLTA